MRLRKAEWGVLVNALWIALAFALPAQATQDGWPALHDVVFVAADDVLNIRAEPNASSEIIGTLAHDAEEVEIIEANDDLTWGRVNTGEMSGWVSMSFMERRPGQWDGIYPEFRTCYGTEPFWDLSRDDGVLTLDVAFDDEEAISETIAFETGTLNHRGRYSFASDSMVGLISRAACNDGMSDRDFGLELNLVLPGSQMHLQGCCSLQPPSQ